MCTHRNPPSDVNSIGVTVSTLVIQASDFRREFEPRTKFLRSRNQDQIVDTARIACGPALITLHKILCGNYQRNVTGEDWIMQVHRGEMVCVEDQLVRRLR